MGVVTDRATLLLLKGKHGRSESSAASIEAALSALLVAANVPFAISHTWQVRVHTYFYPSQESASTTDPKLPLVSACADVSFARQSFTSIKSQLEELSR